MSSSHEHDEGRAHDEHVDLMTPAEVARLFRVSVTTVTKWARSGLLPSVRTLGGHRRFDRRDVLDHLERTNGAAGDEPEAT
ncbi:BldC family transcriptional regulator [Intrasporangium sp. YIM S08009]|uniref:BldC family transcriptional regulator n=1 Tax=Intrasporangium zincisolvens TaxID=3080018 RepID=UPI002B05A639|nr:BldC family transcriptional regulator [Intrasporangium sp. YIM S08009]